VARVIRGKRKYYKKRRQHRKPYRQRRPSRKNVCSYCHRIIRGLPYYCRRCGRTFCSVHHIPETHKCAGLVPPRWPVKPIEERPIQIPSPEPYVPPYEPIPVTRHRHNLRKLKKPIGVIIVVIVIVGVLYFAGPTIVRGVSDLINGIQKSINNIRETKNVYQNGAILVGGDGHTITLHLNPNAKDPTWSELITFLQQDTTDQIPYVVGSFVCVDFAETLFNNAEKAGIRAGFVSMTLSGVGHACNAFRTTDRGIVFIDDTNSLIPTNCDCQVSIMIGQDYVPVSLFSSQQFLSMGTVNNYEITW
jgi:hypothetical protein